MGWVALVGPEVEENLSLRYLSSSLQRGGFETEIVAFNTAHDLPRVLEALVGEPEAPVLVGLSLAFQWRAQDFLALAMALRERGYEGHITAGGHFATFASEELLRDFPELDSVCRQEAEETLVALARAVSEGRAVEGIAGVFHRGSNGEFAYAGHPSPPDLAALPWPDRRGPPASCFGHGIAPVVSSRGCYANCSFCCIAAWHEQTLPGKRYRLRDVNDVADEMLSLQRERGVDLFVFHDDNFFLPGKRKNLERLGALADALDARPMSPFAIAVKARPTDVDPDVFELLVKRLHCLRTYVGVETDADRGLRTLRRWSSARQNHKAIAVLRGLGVYASFNMLLFDPDTTVEDLEDNLAFLRAVPEFPFNFTRVELYAGTPLLERMQREGRCWGDYMQWDYALSSPAMERVFELTMDVFEKRNFGDQALVHVLMGNRFDVEVCRRFHPEVFRAEWLRENERIQTELTLDSVGALARVVACVRGGGDEDALRDELRASMHAKEAELDARARDLAYAMTRALKRGRPITQLGDRAATPLQRAVPVNAGEVR